MKKTTVRSPYMTIAEAAAFLRKTEHTIHTYCRPKDGKPAILHKKKIGGFNTTLLLRSEVEALVQDVEPEHGLTVEDVEEPPLYPSNRIEARRKRTGPGNEGPNGPYPSNRPPAKPRRSVGEVTSTHTLDPDPYEAPDPA